TFSRFSFSSPCGVARDKSLIFQYLLENSFETLIFCCGTFSRLSFSSPCGDA
ncbi:unnamed protein product, partial [Arabidopsis halleri]